MAVELPQVHTLLMFNCLSLYKQKKIWKIPQHLEISYFPLDNLHPCVRVEGWGGAIHN